MAGGKKKKKPASNPARGFATTSIASKPKADEVALEEEPETPQELKGQPENNAKDSNKTSSDPTKSSEPSTEPSPDEFERQLELSELQLLVEKHAQKSKRDAQRQRTRLETDRRLLRGQAETLSTRKWLPPELMEEILDLIHSEGRFSNQADLPTSSKQLSEEELTVRLWTLQQSLVDVGFPEERVLLALQHILSIADKLSVTNKESIWGMEEALEWLARECTRDELPDYDHVPRRIVASLKSQAGPLKAHFARPSLTHRITRYSN